MLTGLTKSFRRVLVWVPEVDNAFSAIKEGIAKFTLVVHPSPHAPIVLVTDVSATAVGAVLQQQIGGSLVPLAFFSRSLEPREFRYNAFDKKLLTIYSAVWHFWYFLENRRFNILTDHKPLFMHLPVSLTSTHNVSSGTYHTKLNSQMPSII